MTNPKPSKWAMEEARVVIEEAIAMPLEEEFHRYAIALDAAYRKGAEAERRRWRGVFEGAEDWENGPLPHPDEDEGE